MKILLHISDLCEKHSDFGNPISSNPTSRCTTNFLTSSNSSIHFPLTSIYNYMDEKNRREERRSGGTGTGVS